MPETTAPEDTLMPYAEGFNNEQYLGEQTEEILERVKRFDNKLYLEFGGKLFFDYHAARVLPGYDPNIKMRLLQKLADKAEIILCIHAGAIERKKVRADFGVTYDVDAMRMIDDMRRWGVPLCAVVVTRYEDQPSAKLFCNKLERRGIRVYTHRPTRGYPTDVNRIVSDEGYGANPYIETTKPLVVVTGPGPGSGKLATCLSQLYHEAKQGNVGGYAKFETFPIWNLPLKHSVNVAYEAATADLHDVNLIDSFHLDRYNETTVNYNRDVEAFPVVQAILERILGEPLYHSPTDMGVNRAAIGIYDDAACQHAAQQEIIRRYFRYCTEYAMGLVEKCTVDRAQQLMTAAGLETHQRVVVLPARQAAEEAHDHHEGNEGVFCGAALQLPDGSIITGHNSPKLHAASALILDTIKSLSDAPREINLLASAVMKSVGDLKTNILGKKSLSLDLEETLIALAISATTNPTAAACMKKLPLLRGCDIHMTHIPAPGDDKGLRQLGVNLTCDANFSTKDLFVS